jgi:ribose 1,5-bisphosphokinase PhnN
MGAGKTTVMGEASDLLAARGIPHAAIDLDAISLPLLPDELSRRLYLRNLTAVARNCLDAGIDRFVIAVAVDSRAVLADLQAAFHGTITVARLLASTPTLESRLRRREPGIRQAEFLERSSRLDQALAAAVLEDFSITNESRSVTDVAQELLERAGWV